MRMNRTLKTGSDQIRKGCISSDSCGRPCLTTNTLRLHGGSTKVVGDQTMQAPGAAAGMCPKTKWMLLTYVVSRVMHGHTWKARKAAKRPRTDAGTVLPCTAVPMESAAQHVGWR